MVEAPRFALFLSQADLDAGGQSVLAYLALAAGTLGLFLWVLARRRRSRRALEARVAELTVLAEVGRALVNAQPDVNELAELTYGLAGQIVETDFFQLGLFEEESYRTVIWVRDGERVPDQSFDLTGGSGLLAWLRTTGQPLLVRDFPTEMESLPARPQYISPDPPRSAVFLPLQAGERGIGAMIIQSRRPSAFSPDHLRLLSVVANQVAASLAQARLIAQVRSRARELELIAEVSRQVSALQPLSDLFQQVVTLIAQTFGHYAVNLFELQGRALELRASTSAAFQASAEPLRLGEGVVGRAAAERSSVVVQDTAVDSSFRSHPALEAARSELAVPLKVEEEVLGVLDIQSAGLRAFPPESVRVMESLAAQLALAILESRNYQAERRRAEHLEAIVRGTSAVASILALDDLLEEVVELVEDRLGFDRVSVFLLEGERLVFRAGVGGAAPRWMVEGLVIPLDGPSLLTRAVRTGKPVLAPDVAKEPDYRVAEGLEDTRSELVVPLLMAGRVLGVMDIQSVEVNRLGPEDEQVLQALASSLSVAVRNARLFAGERRRRVLAEILREVSTALVTTLELDDVLQQILSGLTRLVNFDAVSILMAEGPAGNQDSSRNGYVVRAALGPDALVEAIGETVRLSEPEDTGAADSSVIHFEALDPEDQYHRWLNWSGPHIRLAAPLVVGEDRLGYLVVDRQGLDEVQVEDVELLAAFASQASLAVENARLYTAQREEAWVSTALLQVAEASSRAGNLEEVLQIAARLTAMMIGVERCGVWLAEAGSFRLTAYYAEGGVELEAGLRLSEEDWPPLAQMRAEAAPVMIEPGNPLPESLAAAEGRLLILLPLLARGQVAGAMLIGQSPEDLFPQVEHRIRLMRGIADQTALAIERAMLRESWQEEAWVSMALLQVAEALATERGLRLGLENVARLVTLLAGVSWAAIYRYDESERRLEPESQAGLEGIRAAEFAQVRLQPAELGLDPEQTDAPTSASFLPDPRRSNVFGSGPCLALALRSRGELLGALITSGPAPAGRRMDLLTGFAHQLSLAIERARLAAEIVAQQRLEREVEVARGIQASFLPEACPNVPGWEVCAYWQVARRVGGDFYDFIQLPPALGSAAGSTSPGPNAPRWAVVIADVADKGVPAALFMALSRTLIRATAPFHDLPGGALQVVNDLILADTRSDLFVTVYYLVWDPGTGRIHYAVGGHNPPILMRAGGRPELLPGRGMALGVLAAETYSNYELELGPGDVLVLYTDGVTEALNALEEEFKLERLMEIVAQHSGCSAAEVLEAISQAVDAHAQDQEPFDDRTLVVIRRQTADDRLQTTNTGLE